MTLAISPEAIDLAIKMRSQRVSWKRIGKVLGFDHNSIRYRLDPDYAERHRWRSRSEAPGLMPRGGNNHMTEKELAALLAKVPVDTRGFTARAMGDPLPGRSALDKAQLRPSSVSCPRYNLLPTDS